jgi:tRNA(Ile)-lysidine synthase
VETLSFEQAAVAGLGRWPPGTLFLAAVSGGADSTAMLAALAAAGSYRLCCLHVDHGIRPAEESRGDADAVRRFCKDLDLPCRVITIPQGKIRETAKNRGLGIEAAARLYRHAAWNREARRTGAERILVAHTRDDLLETALMRFLRGSGPAGLAAMPRSRGRIIRPILDRDRAEVLRYLEERGIPYRTDSTNEDPAYLRNRIRTKLVPQLDALFPGWRRAVLSLAETQNRTAAFLKAEAEIRVPWERDGGTWRTEAAAFFAQPEIIREEALFDAADRLADHHRGLTERADVPRKSRAAPRRESLRLFSGGKSSSADLGPVRIVREQDRVILSAGNVRRDGEAGFSRLIKEGGVYKLEDLGLIISVEPPAAAAPRLENGSIPGAEGEGRGFFAALPLVLRGHLPGDFIIRSGRRRLLAKALDRAQRSRYTDIISAEDSAGIAAIIGAGPEKSTVLLCRERGDDDLFFAVAGDKKSNSAGGSSFSGPR